MSQIDWSKAPKGATHFNPHSQGFMKIIGEDVYLWVETGATDYWMRTLGRFGGHDVRHQDGIPRPNEWTGEGLPPVGTVCEASSLAFPTVGGGGHAIFGGSGGGVGERFIKCTVIAHAEVSSAQVAVVNSGNKIGWAFIGKFRPIKTPEQIAADERANEVRRILDAMPHDVISGHTGAIVEWMLADGYRKSEIMDN